MGSSTRLHHKIRYCVCVSGSVTNLLKEISVDALKTSLGVPTPAANNNTKRPLESVNTTLFHIDNVSTAIAWMYPTQE